MSDFSATDVAFTGFRFVRERPKAAVLWAVFQIVVGTVMTAILIAMAGPAMTQMRQLRQPGQAPADPTVALAALGRVLPAELLIMVIALAVSAVLNAAASRAILRPEDRGTAYLRFGADEVRQLLLLLLIAVVWIGAIIVAAIAVAIPSVAVTFAAKPLAPLVRAVLSLGCVGAFIYFGVRLSLAAPLTFDSKRVDLFGSWELTKGRFWKMLGAYLLVVVFAIIVGIVVLMISAAVVGIFGGGFSAVGQLFYPDMSSLGAYFTPARVIILLVDGLAAIVFLPLFLTPAPEIYRELEAGGGP